MYIIYIYTYTLQTHYPAGRKQVHGLIIIKYLPNIYREYPAACLSSLECSLDIRWSSDESERRIYHLAGACPRSPFFFYFLFFFFLSFDPFRSPKQTLSRAPSLPSRRHSEAGLSGFTVLTWPLKEVPVFVPVVYCCCRGDPRRSRRGNVIIAQSASLEPSSASTHKHVDIRKVFQSAFLERCTIMLLTNGD